MLKRVLDLLLENADKIYSSITLLFSFINRHKKAKTMFKQLLFNAIKGAATEELKHLLATFAAKNGEEKAAQLVAALRNSFTLLQDVVDDTKTKIDDTLVDIVLKSLPEEGSTDGL